MDGEILDDLEIETETEHLEGAAPSARLADTLATLADWEEEGRHIWEQMPHEPDMWFERFEVYRNLSHDGRKRTMPAVCQALGKKFSTGKWIPGDVWRASKDFQWKQRADAFWDWFIATYTGTFEQMAGMLGEDLAKRAVGFAHRQLMIATKMQELVETSLDTLLTDKTKVAAKDLPALARAARELAGAVPGLPAPFGADSPAAEYTPYDTGEDFVELSDEELRKSSTQLKKIAGGKGAKNGVSAANIQ